MTLHLQIQNQLTLAANDAVTHALSAQELSYGDMVILHSGTEGEITTLSADTVPTSRIRKLNRLANMQHRVPAWGRRRIHSNTL